MLLDRSDQVVLIRDIALLVNAVRSHGPGRRFSNVEQHGAMAARGQGERQLTGEIARSARDEIRLVHAEHILSSRGRRRLVQPRRQVLSRVAVA